MYLKKKTKQNTLFENALKHTYNILQIRAHMFEMVMWCLLLTLYIQLITLTLPHANMHYINPQNVAHLLLFEVLFYAYHTSR